MKTTIWFVCCLYGLVRRAWAFVPPVPSTRAFSLVSSSSSEQQVLFSLKPRAKDQVQNQAPNATTKSLVDKIPSNVLEQYERAFAASSSLLSTKTNTNGVDTTTTTSSSLTPPSTTTSTATAAATTTTDGNNLLWRGVVVLLCALWASNFAAIKLVVAEPGVDSSLYAVARFGLATASLLPFCIKQLTAVTNTNNNNNMKNVENGVDDDGTSSMSNTGGMDRETLQGAMMCGSWVAFGYIGQLLGLLTTTASKSCVICSLHCVFVAAMAEFWRSRNQDLPFKVQVLAPAALAVVGVSIVELWGTANTANIGDLLSFAQPIGFGMGYLQLEHLMAKRPDLALPVSAIKLFMVTLASLFYFEIGPLLNHAAATAGGDDWALRLPDFGPILSSPLALGGVVYTGLVTTALALWIESVAFSRVSATTASLILTTEPLFAAGFGALALGETFGGSDYVGAACIVGACVLATLMDTKQGETPEGVQCIPEVDDDCEPVRQWPFGGY